MKKKLISTFLMAAMLLSMMAPALAAGEELLPENASAESSLVDNEDLANDAESTQSSPENASAEISLMDNTDSNSIRSEFDTPLNEIGVWGEVLDGKNDQTPEDVIPLNKIGIWGKVLDVENDQTPEGVTVTLHYDDRSSDIIDVKEQQTVDSDGKFHFTDFESGDGRFLPGNYTLTFTSAYYMTKTIPIQITDTDESGSIFIMEYLIPGGNIFGIVTDAQTGMALSEVTVKGISDGTVKHTVTTDETGKYHLEVKAGEYNIEFSKDNYQTYTLTRSFGPGIKPHIGWDDIQLTPKSDGEDTGEGGIGGNEGNWSWKLRNGILTISGTGSMEDYKYSYSSKSSTTPWNNQRSEISKIVIENGITSIGNYAFYRCNNLTSVEIPNSVTDIGKDAFYDCNSLTSVEIPNSVTSIGMYAFSGCSGLTNVEIPNSVTSMEYGTFYRCSNLTNIKISNNITSITESMFGDCSSLTSVEIPNGVTGIGKFAFNDCSSLTSVIIPNSVTSIGYSAFEGCDDLINIVIPDSVINIGEYAFRNCKKLYKIKISNNITSIKQSAFSGCSNLTSIEIPNKVTDIKKFAFYDCRNLMSIVIPNSVTNIGEDAFSNCSSLTSVEIPNSVVSIESGAFVNCSSLTSIIISNSVTSIGVHAFKGCSSLVDIIVMSRNKCYNSENGVLFNKNKTELICFPSGKGGGYVIPDSVTSIERFAFYDCSRLTSVEIPNSVTSIESCAFSDCSSLTSVEISNSVASIGSYVFDGCSSLTSVTIPNSVISIGEYAFRDCNSLTSVTIPNSVTSIGSYAFDGCQGLDVYYEGSEDQWNAIAIGSSNNGLTYATIHYNSPMPISTGKVSIHSANYSIYTGEETLIEARIPNGNVLTADDIRWTSGNEEIIKVVSISSEALDDVVYAWAIVRARGDRGTASVTITLSNGKTASCTVSCMGEKPAPTSPDYQTPEAARTKEGYGLLEYRTEEWKEKYYNYLEKVAEALKKYAETDESKRNAAISAKATEMKENDAQSKSRHLTFVADFPEKWKNYAYIALSTYLYDCTCSKMDFGGSLDTTAMVRTVLNAMSSSTRTYEFDDIVMNVSAFQFSGAKTGTITCYSKTNGKKSYMATVCSSRSECRKAIVDFSNQLEELGTAAAYNVYTAVATDILGKAPSSFTKKWLTNRLGKYINQFDAAGVGNLINDLLTCKEYYDFVQKIASGNLGAAEKLLTSMATLNFDATTLADRAASKAMKELQKAGDALQEAFLAYMKGELKESKLQKFWRTTFGCPVSISVYNSNGEQIGYVGDDDIWYTNAIRIQQSGEAKIIDSYTSEKLSFSIVGTDSGTMSCSVETYNLGNIAVGRTNFYDIPVDSETELSLSLTETLEGSNPIDTVVMKNSAGESIQADEYLSVEQVGGVVINCGVETDIGTVGGTVSGAGTYIRGDAVVLTASPKEGYHFTGWYQGEALVSTSKVYEFSAKEDLALTAAFNLDQSGDIAGPIYAFVSGTDSRMVHLVDAEALLTKDARIFAVQYDENGKMLKALWGEPQVNNGSYTVKFQSNVASGWKMFFLDADNAPICAKTLILQQ